MVVIGVDPGSQHCGYGVVVARGARLGALDGGVFALPRAAALERRLAALHAGVDELVARYQPTALAVEDLYFGRNVRTAMAVGQARGVVLAAAGARSVPCFSYTPQQVKQAVCGTGAADKGQVQRMVAALLSLPAPPEPDHAADALAVAICHLHRLPTGVAIAGSAAASARATGAARKTRSATREVAL